MVSGKMLFSICDLFGGNEHACKSSCGGRITFTFSLFTTDVLHSLFPLTRLRDILQFPLSLHSQNAILFFLCLSSLLVYLLDELDGFAGSKNVQLLLRGASTILTPPSHLHCRYGCETTGSHSFPMEIRRPHANGSEQCGTKKIGSVGHPHALNKIELVRQQRMVPIRRTLPLLWH